MFEVHTYHTYLGTPKQLFFPQGLTDKHNRQLQMDKHEK